MKNSMLLKFTLKNGLTFNALLLETYNQEKEFSVNEALDLVKFSKSLPFVEDDVLAMKKTKDKYSKRYILFGGDHYYPLGGMEDALFSSDDKQELQRFIENPAVDEYSCFDWFHIYDSKHCVIID